jgi:hypothetical protein
MSHARTPEGIERERQRKASYEALRPQSAHRCTGCGAPVSRESVRCLKCAAGRARFLKAARAKQPKRKRSKAYSRTPTAHELREIANERADRLGIFERERTIEQWQREG